MGTAIKTKRPWITNDTAHDPDFLPWRKEALKRGYRSCMALPIVVGTQVFGALGVYGDQADVFDNEEASLLVEVAGDIAFALSVY